MLMKSSVSSMYLGAGAKAWVPGCGNALVLPGGAGWHIEALQAARQQASMTRPTHSQSVCSLFQVLSMDMK